MDRGNKRWHFSISLILGLVLIACSLWVNIRLAETAPGGEEFLLHWNGARAWLTQGSSPYILAVQLETEVAAYGHAAKEGEPRLVFNSPLYAVLLFFPFALIPDFALARAIWMLVSQLAIIVTVIYSVKLADWKPSLTGWIILILFAWFSVFSVQSILSGSPTCFVGMFMVLGMAALRAKRLELAGIMFALTTIFPFPSVLVIIFVIVWGISSKNGLMVLWIVAAIAVFTIIGMFFIPDWSIQFLRLLISYSHEQSMQTMREILTVKLPGVGWQLGSGIMILFGIILIVEWFLARRQDFRWFYWTAGLTLVLQNWIGIPTQASFMIILVMPLILLLSNLEQRLGRYGRWLSAGNLLLLLIGGWIIAWRLEGGVGQIGSLSLNAWGLVVFFQVYLMLGMYWIRWWAIRPSTLYLDGLNKLGF